MLTLRQGREGQCGTRGKTAPHQICHLKVVPPSICIVYEWGARPGALTSIAAVQKEDTDAFHSKRWVSLKYKKVVILCTAPQRSCRFRLTMLECLHMKGLCSRFFCHVCHPIFYYVNTCFVQQDASPSQGHFPTLSPNAERSAKKQQVQFPCLGYDAVQDSNLGPPASDTSARPFRSSILVVKTIIHSTTKPTSWKKII